MIFRKATQADLDYVRQNPFEGAVKDYPYMQIPDKNCYTAIFEGKVVGIGGLNKWREGIGLFWLILTADCLKDGLHGIVALTAIEGKVNELIKTNHLWRAEANIRVDFPQAIRMIEFLGFQKEGRMRKFFPDKTDGYLYSRIL
jgi:hypothetical protein